MRPIFKASLALLIPLFACAIAWAGGVAMVSQKGRAFAVQSVSITRGDIVRFTNDDTFLHQVFVDTPVFNYESAEQEPGTYVEIRFPNAGAFYVRCKIHPKMLLQVEVH